MTKPSLLKQCFENGRNDYALGKECIDNPYKELDEREQWYLGWLHEKRIVYRHRIRTKESR